MCKPILFPNLSLFIFPDYSLRISRGKFLFLLSADLVSSLKMAVCAPLTASIYTNGKKKQCTAKMLITHKISSGSAWKFINMVSPIHTFNYQTFTRFHVRLVRHIFVLWKLHLMSSATEKQHATKFIDAKRKFMELMIRKPLYFC